MVGFVKLKETEEFLRLAELAKKISNYSHVDEEILADSLNNASKSLSNYFQNTDGARNYFYKISIFLNMENPVLAGESVREIYSLLGVIGAKGSPRDFRAEVRNGIEDFLIIHDFV